MGLQQGSGGRGFTSSYVNDKARVLVGVDVYHVPHRAISEGWAEDRDVVLAVRKYNKQAGRCKQEDGTLECNIGTEKKQLHFQ